MDTKLLVQTLAGSKPGFASFTYTSKGTGEKARHTLQLGANYLSLLERSIIAVQILGESDLAEIAEKKGLPLDVVKQGRDEVLASLQKSLDAHKRGEQNEDYTKRGQYLPIFPGLSVNSEDGSLQFFALAHAKIVLVPGEHKAVKSRPLTIAKDAIRAMCPISKFREFALDAGSIHSVRMNGETLELD